MATDLTGDEIAVSGPATQPVAEPFKGDPRTPHRARLLLVYGLLGGVLAVAIGGIAVYAGRSITATPQWSSWRPSGNGLGAVQDVAAHVAPAYKLPNGNQLVDVLTSPPQITTPNGKQTLPLQYLGVRSSGGDQVYPLSGTNAVMFRLCGLGQGCSIATGTPSVARGNLVRREILELALYTFKYVPSIQSVLALPPTVQSSPTIPLIYIKRSDISGLLDKPLADTLRAKTPLQTSIPATEVRRINAAMLKNTFSYVNVVPAPLGGLVLVVKKYKA